MVNPIDAYLEKLRTLLGGRIETAELETTLAEMREHLDETAKGLSTGSPLEREAQAVAQFGSVKTLARKLALVHMPKKSLLQESVLPIGLAIIGVLSLSLVPFSASPFFDHTLSWKIFGINAVQVVFGIACLRASRLLVPAILATAGVLFALLTIWNAAFNVVTPKYGDTTPRWAVQSELENARSQRERFESAIATIEKGVAVFASNTPLKDAGEYGHEGEYKRLFQFSPITVMVYTRNADGTLEIGMPPAATWAEAQEDWKRAAPDALRTYREQIDYYSYKAAALANPASAFAQLPASAKSASRSAVIFFIWFSVIDLIAFGLRRAWLSFRMPPRIYGRAPLA